MAQQVADLEAVLKLNDKDYNKKMLEAQDTSKKVTGGISQNIFSMQNIALGAFTAMAYGISRFSTEFIKNSLQVASSATELQNVLDVTFGKSSEQITKQADLLGLAMGRSALQMREFVSRAGALGKGLGFVGNDLDKMSLQFAQLAVDMGSFWNVSDSEAFTALSASMVGEVEPMKKFGIVMTENNLKAYALSKGVKTLWKDMTEAEKTQVRYNYIMEKTTDVHGDAQKTIGSTANQYKVFQANVNNLQKSLGEELNPAYNKFLHYLNDSLKSMSDNKQAMEDLATIILALGNVVGFTGKSLKFIADSFIKLSGLGSGVGDFFHGFSESLRLMGVSIDNSKDKLEDLNTSTSNALNESTSQFETWGGNLQDVFKGVALDSEKMSLDVAKNTVAILQAYSIMASKMPKAQAIGTISKLAKLEGYSDKETKEITKPLKDVQGLSTKELNEGIKQLQEFIKGGGTSEGWSKISTRNIITGGATGTGGTTNGTFTDENPQNLELEAGFEHAMQQYEDFVQRQKDALEELNKSYEEAPAKIEARLQAKKDAVMQQQGIISEIYSSLGNADSIQSLKTAQEELIGKYFNNAEAMEVINKLYQKYLDNMNFQGKKMLDLTQAFSDTSKIASELATMFNDDLLGAMANVLGSVGGLSNALASGNTLGAVGIGLGIANTVLDFLNKDQSVEERKQVDENFKNSVDDFRKAVDSFTLGQKITFAKLERPSNLGFGSMQGGNLNQNLLTAPFDLVSAILGGDSVSWGANNATIDTTTIKKALSGGGYEGINVDAIIAKYAKRESYRDLSDWGRKKDRIVGYDITAAMEEINKLIQEAYEKNLEGFKQAVQLTTGDFTNKMIEAFKTGGNVSESVNDMFYNAVVQAFFSQEAFEALNKNLGNAISETILNELTAEGINLGIDFKGMTPSEMLEAYSEIFGASSEKLTALLDKLGISAKKASDQLNQVSTKNLPSGLKVASSAYQASNAMYSTGPTTIYQIENNYSKDFSEMVAQAQNKGRFRQTNNVRGGY